MRVKDHGRLTGSSTLHKPIFSAEASIEGRILQARDTLFEEELFHELVREARTMAGNGVTMRRDSIQVSGADEQEILVDLVDADHLPDEAEVPLTNEDNCLANAISYAIHILLSFSHRQNHHRRMQLPPPLTTRRRHTPEYQLLRPIIACLQHTSHVSWLESFLQDIYAILKLAGLSCEYKSAHFSSVNLARKDRPMPKLETLAEEFLRPLESTFSGTLTTSRNSFKVNVRTNLFPPFFGTHYDIEINLPEYPRVQPPSRIGLRDEAAAVITQVIMLDLVTAVSLHRPHLPNLVAQDGTTPEMGKFLTWQPAYPHHGELLASSPTLKHNRKLKVSFSRTELTLCSYYIRGSERYSRSTADTGPQTHSHTWKRDSSGVEQTTMMEFVTEVSKE